MNRQTYSISLLYVQTQRTKNKRKLHLFLFFISHHYIEFMVEEE